MGDSAADEGDLDLRVVPLVDGKVHRGTELLAARTDMYHDTALRTAKASFMPDDPDQLHVWIYRECREIIGVLDDEPGRMKIPCVRELLPGAAVATISAMSNANAGHLHLEMQVIATG